MSVVRFQKPAPDRRAADSSIPPRIESFREYSGANRYCGHSVVTARVRLGTLATATSVSLGKEFVDGFLGRFRELPSFIPQNGISDAMEAAMRAAPGLESPRLLLESVLAVEHSLLRSINDLDTIRFSAIEPEPGTVRLIWRTTRPGISRQAAEIALAGLVELTGIEPAQDAGEEESFAFRMEALREKMRRKRLSTTTAVIRLMATRRGIPCKLVGRQHLLLGEGAFQHHFYASMTDATSIAAQKICADKRQTLRRLGDLRLPTPAQVKVGSIEAALRAADRIGFPVVVKPREGKKGRDISVGLCRADEIAPAFERAHRSGTDVLVEQLVTGLDFRLLVIGGRFVAAVERKPPEIVGDGESTVEALIEAENRNPFRDGFRSHKIVIDDEVLRNLGRLDLAPEAVPAPGQVVKLRTRANISTGGCPIDVTDLVHPENRAMAEQAATGVGLDVAGVDFITPDISRSYREVGGAIIEINARPGMDIHVWPYSGESQDVAGILLDRYFSAPEFGRIPVIAVCGDRGTGRVARMLDRLLRGAGRSVGLALQRRSYIRGERVHWAGRRRRHARELLTRDPGVDTLVGTVSLRQTSQAGLDHDRLAVGIILDRVKPGNVGHFHRGIEIVAKATTGSLVIGCGNLVARERLPAQAAGRLILVAERAADPPLQAHVQQGGAAVAATWNEGGLQVLIFAGGEPAAVVPITPAASAGLPAGPGRGSLPLLYAIAAAWTMGVPPEKILESLEAGVDLREDGT